MKPLDAVERCPRALPVFGTRSDERYTTRAQDSALAAVTELGIRPEADPFNVLVLNYTMKCSLACDFCCYGCSPKRTETMSLDLALSLVDQAAALGVFRECGFTGGEALLFYEEILTVARRMQEHGMPFSMISASGWATSAMDAHRVVDPLADAGMSVLTISFDPSHARFVERACVQRAAAAALRRDVPVVIASSAYSADYRVETEFPDLVGHPHVEFTNRVVLPVGRPRATKVTLASLGLDLDPQTYACYKRVYHDLTVFWDGEAYPCCSVFNRASPGLSLGNAYDAPLATLWARLEGSLKYRVMKRQGFAELFAIVTRRKPELTDRLLEHATSAVGPCHLCNRLFSDANLTSEINECLDMEEVERLSVLMSTVERLPHGRRALTGALAAVLREDSMAAT